MTNFEKYKDSIIAFLKNYDNLPAVVNGKPHYCMIDVCRRCDLHGRDDHCCHKGLVEWLYEEYKEVPKLTKLENMLCQAIQRGWIARDEDGELSYFNKEPYRDRTYMTWDVSTDADFVLLRELGFQSNFPFIKWEDEEPWSIEELLKLEVEE